MHEPIRQGEEPKFRRIVEHNPISMAIVRLNGTIEYINRRAIETLGYQLYDIPTLEHWWIQAYPDASYRAQAVAQWNTLVEAALSGDREIGRNHYNVTCKNGSVKTMIISGVLIADKILLIFEDVTEHKQAEDSLFRLAQTLADRVEERTRELENANTTLKAHIAQLRVNQDLLKEMEKIANVGAWELNLVTGKQVWTESVYRIHELEPDFNPTLENGIQFYAPWAQPIIENAVRRAIDYGESFDLELELFTAKGNHRWVHAIGMADLEHSRIYGIFQDITTHRLADAALQEKNRALDRSVAQLRKLAMELTEAEERERKRVATLLHDNLQQYIVAATMKISLLDCHSHPDENAKTVKDCLALLSSALEASRSLTITLYPPVLLDESLMPALQWLAEWIKDKHGLTVTVTGNEVAAVQSPIRILLFQSVRELLFNIVKHAGVETATIHVDQPDSNKIRIVVADKGCGFPPEKDLTAPSKGIGLFHLRERIAYVGGSFDVASIPGQGATITLTAPLQPLRQPS